MRKHAARNFLDLIPCKNPRYSWSVQADGHIAVVIPRRSPVDRLAQLLYFSPCETRVELDGLGSFLWERMDGEHSVHALSALLHERFGDQAEPLLPRLVQYLQLLRSHRLISLDAQRGRNMV